MLCAKCKNCDAAPDNKFCSICEILIRVESNTGIVKLRNYLHAWAGSPIERGTEVPITLTAKDHVEQSGRLFLRRIDSGDQQEVVDDFLKTLATHPGTAFLADPSYGLREALLHDLEQGREVAVRRIRNLAVDHFIID